MSHILTWSKTSFLLLMFLLAICATADSISGRLQSLSHKLDGVIWGNFFNLSLVVILFSIAVLVLSHAYKNFMYRHTKETDEEDLQL